MTAVHVPRLGAERRHFHLLALDQHDDDAKFRPDLQGAPE